MRSNSGLTYAEAYGLPQTQGLVGRTQDAERSQTTNVDAAAGQAEPGLEAPHPGDHPCRCFVNRASLPSATSKKYNKIKELDHARLLQLVSYDPVTGVFTSLKTARAIGSKRSDGYLGIELSDGDDRFFAVAHRLAWFYVFGVWPKKLIDHIDGDRTHNARANLREATPGQNACNASLQRNNTTGFAGVLWLADTRRWKARIYHQGRQIHLGYFDTREEAAAARANATRVYHGEFARAN